MADAAVTALRYIIELRKVCGEVETNKRSCALYGMRLAALEDPLTQLRRASGAQSKALVATLELVEESYDFISQFRRGGDAESLADKIVWMAKHAWSRANEAQAFACQLTTFFVAPWARGHGLAQMIVAEAEALAKTKGFLMINLDVRATQTRAIQSFEARGFSRYAVNEHYARVDNAYVTGYYFHKELK